MSTDYGFGIEKLNLSEEDDQSGSYDSEDDRGGCARTRPYIRLQLLAFEGERGVDEEDARPDADRQEQTQLRTRPKIKKRKNFCPFCEKVITNYSRHLVQRHYDRDEVKDYIALSNESPTRRRIQRMLITNKIRNLGNKTYNQRVVEGDQHSELLPVKRSSKHAVNNTTHVTCNYCFGLFKKVSLYKHLKNCTERPPEDERPKKKKNLVLRDHAALLLRDNESANRMLKVEVFPKMKKDKYTVVCQSDGLISKFGSNFRFNHRGVRQIYYCSTRMRALARLFLLMKEQNPEIEEFRNCIEPKNFDILVEAVRKMSKYESADGSTKIPTVPAAVCSSLKICANIVKSEAIKNDSLTRTEKTNIMCEIDDFLHLMHTDWSTQVSSNSEKSRRQMKVIKEDLLPDSEDIRTFNRYIHDMCPSYVTMLRELPSSTNYEKLAKLIIGHIISFNRRRPNETVEITLEAYQSTLNKRTEYGRDVQNVLTEDEIRSGEELSIFYVPANKNTKKVPVLLTKTFHEAIDVLIEARDKIGVTSKYLFGRPDGAELFNGSAVLREVANRAGLNCPSTFTANALRHHAATSSQLQPHNETYTKRLSKFMGHDLKTHESYYEMPLPLIQKYKVGHKLLEMIKPSTSTRPDRTFEPFNFSEDSMSSQPEVFDATIGVDLGSNEEIGVPSTVYEVVVETEDSFPAASSYACGDHSDRKEDEEHHEHSNAEEVHDRLDESGGIFQEQTYARQDLPSHVESEEGHSSSYRSDQKEDEEYHEHSNSEEVNDRLDDFGQVFQEHPYARQHLPSSHIESEEDGHSSIRRSRIRVIYPKKRAGGGRIKVIYPEQHTPDNDNQHLKLTEPQQVSSEDTTDADPGPHRVSGEDNATNTASATPVSPAGSTLSDNELGANVSALLRTPPKTRPKKMRWTEQEKRMIYEKFGRNMLVGVYPPRKEVKKVWEEEPVLHNRTLQQVVTFVNNIFTMKQRISTPMRNKIKNMVSKKRTTLSP